MKRLAIVTRLHGLPQANDQSLNRNNNGTLFRKKLIMLCGLFILQQGNIAVTINLHVLISHYTFLIHKRIYLFSMVYKTFNYFFFNWGILTYTILDPGVQYNDLIISCDENCLSNFQICNSATMLCITSPSLIYFITGSLYLLTLFAYFYSSHTFPQYPLSPLAIISLFCLWTWYVFGFFLHLSHGICLLCLTCLLTMILSRTLLLQISFFMAE